tara:strand:+ start:37113 stop:38558 length:1446 start_codon:yes stop_codon:yes gene_type:complete
MANYSITPGVTLDGANGSASSINDSRRIFNFGERVAELAPQTSPFLTYLARVGKKATDDPVFKFLEQRHQYQRRNFTCAQVKDITNYDTGNWAVTGLRLDAPYDQFGREVDTSVRPEFLIIGQIIAIEAEWDEDGVDGSDKPVIAYFRVTAVDNASADYAVISGTFLKAILKPTHSANGASAATKGLVAPGADDHLRIDDNVRGQVVGSAYAEGHDGDTLTGWKDEFYSREGYTQIFKTLVPLFSGSALATRYRGVSNEYMRVYQEKLMEHKMDLEHAFLFGIGTDDSTANGPLRRTWGILPYTEAYGKVKTFAYASATYDSFVDAMEDVFSPESGNSGEKLVLCSRKVMSFFNKLGGNSFLGNMMAQQNNSKDIYAGGSGFDMQNIKNEFGMAVTRISTIYGGINLVAEPLFRNQHENTAIMIDLNNVAYRPLEGNGVSRDTQIITNIQGDGVDGRKDMILTEAGLEISLPETHTVLQFV